MSKKKTIKKKKLKNNFEVNYNYLLTMTSMIMMSIVMALLTTTKDSTGMASTIQQ